MIECTKYTPHNKGALQGFADFFVEKWGLEIKGCSIYMKNGRRWINFPSKEFTTSTGEKGFAPHIKFREKEHMTKFTEAAKAAVDKWCDENKEVKEDLTQPHEQQELPF